MNLLLREFLDDPQLLGDLVEGQTREGRDTVGFEGVMTAVIARQAGAALAALSLFGSVSDSELITELLSDSEADESDLLGSYLPIVERDEWESWIATASRWSPVEGSEWATFVTAPTLSHGFVLPNDESDNQRFSLFRRTNDMVRRISVEVPTDGPLAVAITSGSRHCDIPDRGICRPGCGTCTLRLREVEPWGLICLCDHEL
jgi:hypothetical protein